MVILIPIIQGYYKRNRQFQHFINPKLFKISTLMMHGFVENSGSFTTAAHDDVGNGRLEITSMQIYPSAGLGAQQATTSHSHVGHHKVLI
jgi:hypothetical protein